VRGFRFDSRRPRAHAFAVFVAGTPIFKMTADARELGKFNLNFNARTKRLESLDWEIMPGHGQNRGSARIRAGFRQIQGSLLEQLAVPVGATAETLDALSLSSRTKETNIGNFIADAYRAGGRRGRRAGQRRLDPRGSNL
jgi:2',3'-cyclic-nucleotide 2'-phosphodiesterase (5'-nucleotidase family)